MSIDFYSPSYRASQSDLTVSVSPFGLVELADEEFEVHGPRLNRYANHWAWYLGHHYANRAPAGEPQLVVNYTKALSDFITSWCFGRGVYFRTPLATSAIVPDLLQRVWEIDNDKASLLWEMGTHGGVSGDCFVKIAYEEPWMDPAGNFHAGRVRILPINAAFAYPVWHPHDRDKLLQFKLKYKFFATGADGTRQVMTYVEIISDTMIQEFVNDVSISERPNPLGVIPVVHWPNLMVPGSPWGMSDIDGLIPLNRQYNETVTAVADIVNYHAEPVTVITGAKASQLEKGAKKVWGGLPKDAEVFNLELSEEGIAGAVSFLELLKKAMHEISGVPEGALGDVQPISNTSGVALAIQYSPMESRRRQKLINYNKGVCKINELVLRTLAIKEPLTFEWNAETDADELKEGQLPVLDPDDPNTYRTECHWPPPLPLDILVKLNEIQMKMALGMESKRGALRDLGEEFPDDKMLEIYKELIADALDQGALDMLKSKIQAAVLAETGMVPGQDGIAPQDPPPSAGGPGVTTAGGAAPPPPMPAVDPQVAVMLNNRAYGTKSAQWRNPSKDPSDND
jgi:hypothetical protein